MGMAIVGNLMPLERNAPQGFDSTGDFEEASMPRVDDAVCVLDPRKKLDRVIRIPAAFAGQVAAEEGGGGTCHEECCTPEEESGGTGGGWEFFFNFNPF